MSLTDALPLIERAQYERGRRYRRDMNRSSHEESANHLRAMLGRRGISPGVQAFVENTLALHEEILGENETSRNIWEKEIWLVQMENVLGKRLEKGSSDWEKLKDLTKDTIRLRYGDYFKQNVAAIRAIAKEDTEGQPAKKAIATSNWKRISAQIKLDDGLGTMGIKKALEELVVDTNMTTTLAEFNIHEYAARNKIAHSGLDELLLARKWNKIAELLYCDRRWLEDNDFASFACDKTQLLQTMSVFQKRIFAKMEVSPDDITGEISVDYIELSEGEKKIQEVREKRETRLEAEKLKNEQYIGLVDTAKGINENHHYDPLRRARKDLLGADAEAEEAKDRKGLRDLEIERKKKALHFETIFKEAKEMGHVADS